MPVFSYVARDQSGASAQGEVQAASSAEAARLIRAEGKFIIKIEPKGTKASAKPKAPPAQSGTKGPAKEKSASSLNKNLFGEKYKPDDLIYFTNQLAVMVETGVSLSEALDACVHEGNSPRFARALDSIIESVRGGSEFSAALMEHPKVFSNLYSSLIKASEASGMMAPMLRRMGVYLEAQREMRRKIKGAITYPISPAGCSSSVTFCLRTVSTPWVFSSPW